MTITVCLVAIVKNESKIIMRMLDSAKTIIDSFCICDTGSQDNTIELIETWGKENGISGMVHKHRWKNFGFNRTASIVEVRRMEPLPDYLLFLDADMVLKIKPTFNKQNLTADCYSVIQENKIIRYYNTRLVKTIRHWVCIGYTHEYYSADDCTVRLNTDDLFIEDLEDGGSKSNKFKRDIELLKLEIKEKGGERPMFYLAKTYHDIEEYDLAISWYQTRIDLGGFDEEVWYSKFRIGECYEKFGQRDLAIACYLDAYNMRPTRAETIFNLARLYRREGSHLLAYHFIKLAQLIPYPKDDLLFIYYNIYEGLIDYEIGIIAYYLDKFEEGKLACLRALSSKVLSAEQIELAQENITFYEKKL